MTDDSIRRAHQADADSIWSIFREVIEEGDAFLTESASREDVLAIWLGPGVATFVACENSGVVSGAYCLKPNHGGRGNHIANVTYMVRRACRGHHIGTLLGEHSLKMAKESGYIAIQFNCVVSTNQASVALWKRLGFSIVGTLPQAFRHARLGLVDVYVMHKFL